ncbi:hypothetical protein LXL04_031717 [Taraxacum kok-saghyz]
MKVTSPSRVTFELTCVKCDNANINEVDWRDGADRFKKTTTCSGVGCHENLSMWEIPQRLDSITPIIAIKGHFNLKERIVDTEITWAGRIYDNLLDFHTTGDGNGTIPEVEDNFNRLINSEDEDEEDADEGDDAGDEDENDI